MTGEAIKAIIESGRNIEWYCPQLLPSPKESMDMVCNHINNSKKDRIAIIGSSLGGFYANFLAEKYQCPAVVLNPAVWAPRELAPHVGMLTMYDTNEPFDFKSQYIEELQALQIENITNPERYFLIASKGDELLSWEDMVAFYPDAHKLVLEESDHGISDYALYLPIVTQFILKKDK